MVVKTTVNQYPKLGEVFELEFDADDSQNTPLGMIEAFGYNSKDWGFTGTPLTGRLKARFKLVQIGYQANLDAVKATLEAEHGPTPLGQWIKAFKDTYPYSDGGGPVGVADASWISLEGPSFLYLGSRGEPYITYVGQYHSPFWRWLVTVTDGG